MTDSTAVTATAVQEIAKLAQDARIAQTLDIGNYKFSDKIISRINVDPQAPTTLEFYTLDAFAAYLKAENESPRPLVHVESPRQVTAVSALFGVDSHLRRIPARAVCKVAIQGFAFNTAGPLETLNIALQTCFEPARGQIDDLRKFCASVRSSQSIGVADDGVSQQIEAKRGIAAVQPTAVSNPWALAPWRTFSEVAQPISPFILRFIEDDAPRAGLYETGDASWQVDAVRAIAKELRALLGDGWMVLG